MKNGLPSSSDRFLLNDEEVYSLSSEKEIISIIKNKVFNIDVHKCVQ